MIRTPKFWHQPRGILAFGLWPFGRFFGGITALRQRWAKKATRATCPVICIGNINAVSYTHLTLPKISPVAIS